tara:strand:- start:720 stop:1031 length:312 start_codon:yes stop_codon:yes gene_type:complete
MKQMVNGQLVDMTQSEIDEYNERNTLANNTRADRKLGYIKELRLQRLIETDYLAMSDNTMSDEIKAFRKSMRDIPQDYSADKYDELLARDASGNLTHSVWSKP